MGVIPIDADNRQVLRRKAKQVELDGWDYPKHLSGRAYGVVGTGTCWERAVASRARDWMD